MSLNIKNLLEQLRRYYKRSGRKPEGLYDLLLSFIFWEAVSEQKHAETGQSGILYNEIMRAGVSPKDVMAALRSCEKLIPHLPKKLLLPDKDSIDHLPDKEWQQICTEWIDYRKHRDGLGENTLEAALDHLETLVADPRNDEGYLSPRAVTDAVVQYLDGGKGTSLYDPYPRSGNLLAAAAAQIGVATNIKSASPPNRLAHKLMTIRFLLLNKSVNTLPDFHRRDTAPALSFDYILSNPPFGIGDIDHMLPYINNPWTTIAQKSSRRLDVAFLCHILSHLSDDGKAAVILPTIYLSSSNTVVSRLVKEIVDQNLLDVVIKLPRDLFATTKVATAVLCFDKARTQNQEVYFIDATKAIEKKEKQVVLDACRLQKWINQVKRHTADKDIGKATTQLIAQHEYNLQPEQYLDAPGATAAIHKTAEQLWQECELLQQELVEAYSNIQKFLDPGNSIRTAL